MKQGVDLTDTSSLQNEFNAVRIEMNDYHESMQFYAEAYETNVYFKAKPNSPARERVGVNLLQAFADKNWFYLSTFPKINVPALPENREGASKTEKLLYASHDLNDTDQLWGQLTFDGTVMSSAIVVTDVDYKSRRVRYQRIDPRRAYWTTSDLQGTEPEVFWTAIPMRKSAIKRKWGVDVSGSGAEGLDYWKDYDTISTSNITDDPYYMVVTRVDHDTMTRWCGDKFLMTSHKHMLGCMPVDIALPLRLASNDYRGDFFLRRLKDLQAQFNECWRQRQNIVARLGNPAVWGRNINNNQLQDVKDGLSMDGGFIGLKENGELGILTIPETAMIDKTILDIYGRMQDIAGFPPAAFGNVAGANTSGDALGMYYQPTTRQIDHQNKAYKRLLQNVNKKTIILYRTMLKSGEAISLDTYAPKSKKYAQDGVLTNDVNQYETEFRKEDLVTTHNIVTTSAVTPKDDITYKRLMADMMRDGSISKTTGLDELGFLSPQDEIDLLEAETSNPKLNPHGMSELLSSQAQMQQAENGAVANPAVPAPDAQLNLPTGGPNDVQLDSPSGPIGSEVI